MPEIILQGHVKKGHRIASGLNPDRTLALNNTIFLQKPFFEKAFIPNISKVYNGTINIDIAPKKFKIIKPDYEVTCEWIEGVVETFWLVNVKVCFMKLYYNGYIYYPCTSEIKSHDDDVVELLIVKISNLQYGEEIMVYVPAKKITV